VAQRKFENDFLLTIPLLSQKELRRDFCQPSSTLSGARAAAAAVACVTFQLLSKLVDGKKYLVLPAVGLKSSLTAVSLAQLFCPDPLFAAAFLFRAHCCLHRSWAHFLFNSCVISGGNKPYYKFTII
jgi:hypothetical protein